MFLKKKPKYPLYVPSANPQPARLPGSLEFRKPSKIYNHLNSCEATTRVYSYFHLSLLLEAIQRLSTGEQVFLGKNVAKYG